MKKSLKVGLGFGLTSGIITTLGLIVGLNSAANSKAVILGGIITIAIADAFSDSLGIHISEESEGHPDSQVWEATLSTFLSKLIFALTFVIPVYFLPLETAIVVSILWGFSALGVFSYYIASQKNTNPWKSVGEHVTLAVVVIILTNFIGQWVGTVFV
jgi:vacuolar iron transporter family protein